MSKYAQLLTELMRVQVERNIILKEMEDIVGFDISFSPFLDFKSTDCIIVFFDIL